MTDRSFVVLATLSAQALAATLITALLLSFFRQYRKTYLYHWTLSWAALSVYHLAEAGAITLPALAVPFSALAGMASYLQIGWLLFGVHELVRRRPVRIRHSRWI